MSDLVPTLAFLACLGATLALVQVCDWLLPKPERRPGQGAASQEADQ